jgi:flagellar motor switch protein FliM
LKDQLTQQQIDSFFDAASNPRAGASGGEVPFDFRRLDRIPKSQVSAIHMLHEAFVRSFSSSLTLYLRAFVSGNLISVEQLPYSDFAEALPTPTCLVYLNMDPYQGYALIEVSPALIGPILDLVLGGGGKEKAPLSREITEVEKALIEGFFHIFTHDLRETWKPIANITFAAGAIETSPQPSGRFVANEAVVAVSMELRIGDNAGVVNLAIPSITLKTMGQSFDQQWATHRSENPETEQLIRRMMTRDLDVTVQCEYSCETIRLKDLLSLVPGDIFAFGPAFNENVDILVNGTPKFKGTLGVSRKNTPVVVIT